MTERKETVLVLDDDPITALALCKALEKNEAFKTLDANNIQEAEQKLRDNQVDILVFDVGLDKRDLNVTSIDFAIKIDREKPRPLLFYTHYSSKDVPEFFNKTRQIEHSTWSARKGMDWETDILNGITLAKEKFLLKYKTGSNEIRALPYRDLITFKEWRGADVDHDEFPRRRVFLHKNDILFISSDRSRKSLKIFQNAFEPSGEGYSAIFTRSHGIIRCGIQIGSIMDQMEKYQVIDWHFKRVHKSYIINVDFLEEYNNDDKTLKLNGFDLSIPVTDTYFKDSDASDLFPFLGTD